MGTRHDFIHFVVFWFSWKDHYIINILRLLHNNDGVATNGSHKVFNQKLTGLSQAWVRVLVVLCKCYQRNWLSQKVGPTQTLKHGHNSFPSQKEEKQRTRFCLLAGWVGAAVRSLSEVWRWWLLSLSSIKWNFLTKNSLQLHTMSVSGIFPLYMCGKYIQCSAVGGDADGKPLECSMIAPGQGINPLQFTKLHNKTISKHFYESPTFASLCPAKKGCWSKKSLAVGWSQSRQQYTVTVITE